jgi:general secretion pathway protein G
MSANRIHRSKGFTLVEILIVVVILGILAAIVIPQFTNASESAKSSSLVSQLQTIRSQLELYQVQHNGSYPTLAQLQASWGVLTSKTDVDGTINTAGAYGPYLQQPPRNSIENSSTVAAAAAAGVGWVYDASTGSIKANLAAAKATALGTSATDVATY